MTQQLCNARARTEQLTDRCKGVDRVQLLKEAAARRVAREAFWCADDAVDTWDGPDTFRDTAYLAYLAGGVDPRD